MNGGTAPLSSVLSGEGAAIDYLISQPGCEAHVRSPSYAIGAYQSLNLHTN